MFFSWKGRLMLCAMLCMGLLMFTGTSSARFADVSAESPKALELTLSGKNGPPAYSGLFVLPVSEVNGYAGFYAVDAGEDPLVRLRVQGGASWGVGFVEADYDWAKTKGKPWGTEVGGYVRYATSFRDFDLNGFGHLLDVERAVVGLDDDENESIPTNWLAILAVSRNFDDRFDISVLTRLKPYFGLSGWPTELEARLGVPVSETVSFGLQTRVAYDEVSKTQTEYSGVLRITL